MVLCFSDGCSSILDYLDMNFDLRYFRNQSADLVIPPQVAKWMLPFAVTIAVLYVVLLAFGVFQQGLNRFFSHQDPMRLNGVPLKTYLINRVPSLRVFKPTWWLFNGHLQTIYIAMTKPKQKVKYERELINAGDDGQLALDWYPKRMNSTDKDDFLIVILHGLTGGSHEPYIVDLVKRTRHRCVIVHSRGCNGSPVLTPQLFSGGGTQDVRTAVDYINGIKQTDGEQCKLIMIGYSLGAQILVNYLGEEHIYSKVHAAFSVGNPFDMLTGSIHLQSTWFNRKVYAYTMGRNLYKLFRKHAGQFKDNPLLNLKKISQVQSVREFDELVTRRLYGYNSVNEYYRLASSVLRLPYVRCPLICFNARDDPICPKQSIPYDEASCNPYVLLVETAHGGHLGWFQGWLSPNSWISGVIAHSIDALTNVTSIKQPDWFQPESDHGNNDNVLSPSKSLSRSLVSVVSQTAQNLTPLDFVDVSLKGVQLPIGGILSIGFLTTSLLYFWKN
ncbi:hypothetical protein MP228_007384 [Amoeboaphelidium protococcarum]|nr:hypothetical protein MP228_007384 [Amoeboaphelidium protococcarum]